MNPIDIACDYESLNVIVRDLDVKIANLEKKIQPKQPNNKSSAHDLKNSGTTRHNHHTNNNNNNNNNTNNNNNNNGHNSNSRFSSQSNLDNHDANDATSSDDSADDEPVAIVQLPKKNDPNFQHLDSLKKIRANIVASLDTLDKQKKSALKITQVDTMKRNVDDINKLKWLLTVQDTLKHLNEDAKKELLTCPEPADSNAEPDDNRDSEAEPAPPKEPLLTAKQLELIEKSIPFICPSRIDYDAKFSVQLDTSSKFIQHLSDAKRKEALPGINFRNLKELLKKLSDAPYFSDRQRHQKTRNNSPEQGNNTNVTVETAEAKQETPPPPATNEKPADKPAEQIQNEESKPCDEPVPKDSSDHSEKVNSNSNQAFDIKKMPEILSVDGDSQSPKPDQANDNMQGDQAKNTTRASHGYPPRKVYDNSRGRSSRGGGSRYNDRRRNYHQYERKEFTQRGSDGAERLEYGNQNARHHQSSQRYKHSQNKNMAHAEHNGTVPTGNGSNGTTMVYPNMQNDIHDPAVIAASLSHPNGGGISSPINVHAMQNTAHTIMYH